MVGVAVSLGRPKEGEERTQITKKIVKRSLYLILIGLFLNAFPHFELSTLRIPGVLQRIGLVFLTIGIMYHYVSLRRQVLVASILLISYWAMMTLIPVPEIGPANLEKDTNLAAWFDRIFLTGHMWSISQTWDPEGLLSTLPAIVTGLLGIFSGKILLRSEDKMNGVSQLFVLANAVIVLGLIWDLVFPMNKSLWTSSFVLYTGGIAMHFFAVLYWLLDIKNYQSPLIFPFQVLGSNAITAYALSGILVSIIGLISIGETSLHGVIYNGMVEIFDDYYFASLLYALAFVSVCYLPVLVLYRKNIFIKV